MLQSYYSKGGDNCQGFFTGALADAHWEKLKTT